MRSAFLGGGFSVYFFVFAEENGREGDSRSNVGGC